MKPIPIILLLLIASGCKSDEESIRECYADFTGEILDGRPEMASDYVDERTFDYYEILLDQIISGDSISISQLNAHDKSIVLIIRNNEPQENILSLSGRSLFELLYTEKYGSFETIRSSDIGEITVSGDFATGDLLNNGQSLDEEYDFYKVQGEWKVDISSMFDTANYWLEMIIAESNSSDIDYILDNIEQREGVRPDSTIWNPLK